MGSRLVIVPTRVEREENFFYFSYIRTYVIGLHQNRLKEEEEDSDVIKSALDSSKITCS